MRNVHATVLTVASALAVFAALPAAQQQPTPSGGGGDTTPRIEFVSATTGLPRGGFWKSTPVLRDLNGDGFVDLAIHPRLDKTAHVFLGDGKGGWTESSSDLTLGTGTCGGGLSAGDVDKNGTLDLVIADHCSGVFVFRGDGKGRWSPVVKNLASQTVEVRKDAGMDPQVFVGTEGVALGDVNEDGFLDMISVAADRGGFTVWLGDGTGRTWREAKRDGLPSLDDPFPVDENEGGWANELRVVDMNGDGHLDLVASYYIGPRVWLGDGKGQWKGASTGLPTPTVGGLYQRLEVGDINGDKRPDIAVANMVNGAEAYLQRADGTWEATADPLPSLRGGAHAITLADFDGDGHTDLAVAGILKQQYAAKSGLFVVRGDGRGGWTELPAGLPAESLLAVMALASGDIDGDGRPDLVAGLAYEKPFTPLGKPAPEPPTSLMVLLNRPGRPATPGGPQ